MSTATSARMSFFILMVAAANATLSRLLHPRLFVSLLPSFSLLVSLSSSLYLVSCIRKLCISLSCSETTTISALVYSAPLLLWPVCSLSLLAYSLDLLFFQVFFSFLFFFFFLAALDLACFSFYLERLNSLRPAPHTPSKTRQRLQPPLILRGANSGKTTASFLRLLTQPQNLPLS